MLRRAVTIAALAAAVAAPASAAPIRGQTLMPGVVYSRQVEFTTHGPVVVHVVSAPKPVAPLYEVKAVLSNNAIIGRERLTSMQRGTSAAATVVGTNGDLFARDGRPDGIVIRSGVLDSSPNADRSSVGVDTGGNLHVERVALEGSWKGTGQRRLLGINEAPRRRSTLYTPAWGPRTPPEADAVEAILQPFPRATPNVDLSATVVQVVRGGDQAIPPDGAVLVARTDAAALTQEAPVGSQLTVRLTLTPPWTDVAEAVGGGPIVVRNGKPVFRSFEQFTAAQLAPRQARTAIGQTADGRLLLVAVDGRQPGYSTGLTNFELALLMMRLGAVTASALDYGASTALAFDGKLLNRPSDPTGERAVADALLVSYYGVYVPALADAVLSPNGDDVAEAEALSYRLVRPSTVDAVLTGPGGAVIRLAEGARPAGTERFSWSGKNADGSAAPEGKWTFSVTAEDDRGRRSVADRQFSLNTTLANLAARTAGRQLRATFTLTRAARVVARVETRAGAVVATVANRSLGSGDAGVAWRGHAGRFVLSVTATNEIGSAELTAPFTLRR